MVRFILRATSTMRRPRECRRPRALFDIVKEWVSAGGQGHVGANPPTSHRVWKLTADRKEFHHDHQEGHDQTSITWIRESGNWADLLGYLREMSRDRAAATPAGCPITSPEGRYQGREARAQPHPSLL
jgi:hypothetical protein